MICSRRDKCEMCTPWFAMVVDWESCSMLTRKVGVNVRLDAKSIIGGCCSSAIDRLSATFAESAWISFMRLFLCLVVPL